jgi:hypothetical protein
MKKNHKLLILTTLLVLTIFSVSLASAATTLQVPIANSNQTGTITLISCQTNLVNAVNATILYNYTGSSAINILIANISNTTDSGGSFNASATSITGLTTDSMTYNFWCRVTNLTGATDVTTENSTVNTGITIDNTDPVCSISVDYPLIHSGGPQYVTWSVTDALSLVSNSEAITVPSPGTQITDTSATGTSVALTAVNTSYVGTWYLNAYGIDRAGNTCNATTTFISDQPGGSVTIGAAPSTPGLFSIGGNPLISGTTGQPNWGLLLIIGLVIAVIVVISKKK